MTLPTCGSCPFAVAGEAPGDRWCHGAPPMPYFARVVGTEAREAPASMYPPVGADKVGCRLHPAWPKRRWWRPWK